MDKSKIIHRRKFDLSKKTPEEIQTILSDAWLNIIVDENTLYNPLENLPENALNSPHLYFSWLMSQPEYFGFTCKHLFNIELLPVQALILKEMWNRKFPMLIATRGMGKAEGLDNTILTSTGWVKMRNIKLGDKVYGRDGKLHNIIGIHPQGKKQICRIEFLDGRIIDCCEDHLWVVKSQKKEITISTKDMIKSGISYDKTDSGGKVYKYKIPNCEPLDFSDKKLSINPYILGCLLGDGTMNSSTPKIASNDDFIIQQFRDILDGFEIKRDSTNNNYTLVDISKGKGIFLSKSGERYENKLNNRLTTKIKNLKLNVKCKEKFIPEEYKYSSIEDRFEIIRGLLDTDGSINKEGSIEFTNTCERLVDDLIDILRGLGISCSKKIDDRSDVKQVFPSGKEDFRKPYFRVFINTSKPVFKLPRKLNRIKKQSTSGEKYISIIGAKYIEEYEEMQCISVDNKDYTYITKDYIVTHNSFLMSIYALLRALFMPGRKIIICGSAFRQSKVLYEYITGIWNNSPILRDIVGTNGSNGPRSMTDMCRFTIQDSTITALPIGNGEKIRGQRANDILADEFSAQSRETFETVIAGFAAVSANPSENVKDRAEENMRKWLNIIDNQEKPKKESNKSNQIVISGTAYYDFNHFGEYWKRWKQIINSKGDKRKLLEVFNGSDVPENFRWDDYSIIRIPYELVPKGFMDDGQVARSKATIHSGIYEMEYAAVFSNDSNGFFKRSLIESCVSQWDTSIVASYGEIDAFKPLLHGDSGKKYVYGIDPASEVDNFSIVILEIHEAHRRIVNVWTTNRTEHKEKIKRGIVREIDFYSYCARKIRDLMKTFPTDYIAMDKQGGGVAVMEALHDPDKIDEGEIAIWERISDKPKDTDAHRGLHIIELVQFASSDWTSESNHGLRKDFEDKALLFPAFDAVELAIATGQDRLLAKQKGLDLDHIYDTMEDCVMEIEELKDELSTITIETTTSGRERWDTPEVKLPGGKKGRLRKDRYSSLLMANMLARQVARDMRTSIETFAGGFASYNNVAEDVNFVGPADITEQLNNLY
jgi:hypothetical protein